MFLWASAFVAIRQAGRQISPGALSLGRLAIGSALLGGAALTHGRGRPSVRDWRLLVVCGVVWFGIYMVTLNEAERHMDAGIAAMIVYIAPILIVALAGLLLGEGFPRGLLAGGALAFVGVVVIGVSTSSGSHADTTGVLLCIVAAISYAVGVVSQKPLLDHLPALMATWLSCTIGMIACLPFVPALVYDLGHASALSIALMVYLGAGPTALAFTTWAYALRRTTAGRMGATTYLVPPLALLMGWLLLGEQPALLALGGGVLCLGGVGVARLVAPA